MERPTAKALREAAGISPSYAHMILSGDREPPRPLAIHIFRSTGWRHASIEALTDDQIGVLEAIEPWVPPSDRPAKDAAA